MFEITLIAKNNISTPDRHNIVARSRTVTSSGRWQSRDGLNLDGPTEVCPTTHESPSSHNSGAWIKKHRYSAVVWTPLGYSCRWFQMTCVMMTWGASQPTTPGRTPRDRCRTCRSRQKRSPPGSCSIPGANGSTLHFFGFCITTCN